MGIKYLIINPIDNLNLAVLNTVADLACLHNINYSELCEAYEAGCDLSLTEKMQLRTLAKALLDLSSDKTCRTTQSKLENTLLRKVH